MKQTLEQAADKMEPKHTEVWVEGRTIFEQKGEPTGGIKVNLEEIPSNVDLEKELDNYMDGYFSECQDGTLLNEGGSELQYEDVYKIARHFYELGLNAKK